MRLQLEDVAIPLARLLGHSLTGALGFCALGAIALIPVLLLRLLVAIGVPELAEPLRVLEITLLLADILLFAVIFVGGVAVFAVETIGTAWRRIRAALDDPK
jgi:hypothetical protein